MKIPVPFDESLELIGSVEFGGLTVKVRIVDARRNSGGVEVLVTPTCGHGLKWMPARQVQDICPDPG